MWPAGRRRATAGNRGRGVGKSLDIRRKSRGRLGGCGAGALRAALEIEAQFLPEAQDADGLLNAAQGDVEGVQGLGLEEDAVQADLQEVEMVQELVEVFFPGQPVTLAQGPAEMLEVSGEGRGRDAVPGGQGAEGVAVHQGLVDLRPGGVGADGAAVIHGLSFSRQRLAVSS
jgi:hypothetical protein